MPRRSNSEPAERAATRGDLFIAESFACVSRACHRFLMERTPGYADEYRRNSARCQAAADRRKANP